MKPALTHIALHVRDIEASLSFYEKFCDLRRIHRRTHGDDVVAWLAEPGRESDFVLVFISGGPRRHADGADYSHLGFAVESREAVDDLAERGRQAGCLAWPACEDPYPVGYYCGLRDPDGNFVEFSYGQPLGPGSQPLAES